MPNEKNEEWYYCEECNKHFRSEKQVNECLRFGHFIKKRVPVELRTVYKSSGYDVPKILNLNVDDDVWQILVRMFIFRTSRNIQGKTTTRFLTKVGLSPPLKNMVNHLRHLFPFLKLTTKQLTSLLQTAIRKGFYDEAENGLVVVYLCLNDWMKLRPKTDRSKLICTTYAKFSRLKKTDSEVLGAMKVR